MELIDKIPNEPEMSVFESAFLCGVLRQEKPKKILEVGVAGGATSAIILQATVDANIDEPSLYSVDYSEKLHRDSRYKSGFLCEQAEKKINGRYSHHLYLGDLAVSFVEKEFDKMFFDCLVLDTVHSLPGELLDFVTLLPYIKDDGCVIR